MQSGVKSAWEVVRQLSLDKQQSTYSQGWKSLGDSSPGLYCIGLVEAYVMQEKCQFEDLDEKKRYDTRLSNRHSHKKPSERKAERGKNAGTNPGTRFPWASYFDKTCNVCQKHGSACTTWYPGYKTYGNGTRNWSPTQPRKVQRN